MDLLSELGKALSTPMVRDVENVLSCAKATKEIPQINFTNSHAASFILDQSYLTRIAKAAKDCEGTAGWVDWCLAFVRRIVVNMNLEGLPPDGSESTADEILFSTETPTTIYSELVKYNRIQLENWENLPAGAILFWKGLKKKNGEISPGHVAICIKGGADPLLITTPWTNGVSMIVSEMSLSKIKQALRIPNGWMVPVAGWKRS